MPAPISINDLSNDEFLDLISKYNHQQLAKNINQLKKWAYRYKMGSAIFRKI